MFCELVRVTNYTPDRDKGNTSHIIHDVQYQISYKFITKVKLINASTMHPLEIHCDFQQMSMLSRYYNSLQTHIRIRNASKMFWFHVLDS